MVDDLNACIAALRDEGYKKIILAGHSQGSLLGMLAADNADGYISMAGSIYPINETMLIQYGVDRVTFANEINTIKMLEQGLINEEYAKDNPTFSINNQKFLISWMKYDPKEEITKLNIPILLLQGESDLQVMADDFVHLTNANPVAESYLIDTMNHLLKRVENDDENMKSYQDPSFLVHDELIIRIVEFVSEVQSND